MRSILLALAGILCLSLPLHAEVKKYEFTIDYILVNKTGEQVKAMGIGGMIPAPLIEARMGDTLEVTFHNRMDVETSVHWHGILLPPEQDGVPWLNTRPIGGGESFTFRFDIKHTGTFWYHSHTGLQEERGIYGPIRLLPSAPPAIGRQDKVLVWSDWTNENPDKILRNLKRDGDYYARKKGSVQSWDKVIAHGLPAIQNRLRSSMNRMGPMDLSDVGYDAFLANGEQTVQLAHATVGETVRVRMINAATSSYFNIEYAGGPMTIIAVDGVDVEPLLVKRLKHAIAETYDVLVTMPRDGNFEIKATNVDGTGHASAFIGNPAGPKVLAPEIGRPNPFMVDHSSHDMAMAVPEEKEEEEVCLPMHAAMGHCTPKPEKGEILAHLTTYAPLRATEPTNYDEALPVRKIRLKLTGNMERYIWSFNGKTMSEADRILIKKGERVQFIFENTTMMSHPLHLHGHFFRVLNGQGDYSPLKHTVDLASMSNITIEFEANEERDWIFHCHNLYHMKSGMSRVVSYAGTSNITDAFARNLSTDDHWYRFADIAPLSNQHFGRMWMVNNRYSLEAEWEGDYHGSLTTELRGEYFYNRYTDFFVGGELERDQDDTETVGYAGIAMVLPFLIESELRIDTNGHLRFGLGSDLQLTNRLKFMWDWNTDEEHSLTLDYELNKGFSLIVRHHDEYDFGVGLKLRF